MLLADSWLPSTSCQVTQIVSQQQVQAELTLRLTQLQTRLASLKIENEEVSHTPPPSFPPTTQSWYCGGVELLAG